MRGPSCHEASFPSLAWVASIGNRAASRPVSARVAEQNPTITIFPTTGVYSHYDATLAQLKRVVPKAGDYALHLIALTLADRRRDDDFKRDLREVRDSPLLHVQYGVRQIQEWDPELIPRLEARVHTFDPTLPMPASYAYAVGFARLQGLTDDRYENIAKSVLSEVELSTNDAV
jgi:hypothetical protein